MGTSETIFGITLNGGESGKTIVIKDFGFVDGTVMSASAWMMVSGE